jgi:FemAB-related protein (PEP-CTERM system-associated)
MKSSTSLPQPPSNVQVTLCQAEISDAWSALIRERDDANLGQAAQWHTVIRQAYRHTPLYLQAEDSAGVGGILPTFLIRSWVFGTTITSMPFLDAGGPCASSDILADALVSRLLEEATHHGATVVELRCTRPLDLPVQPARAKVNLSLPLPKDPDRLWSQLDAKVRNQIRKAERSGLTIEFGATEKLREFYNVFAQNMRDLGSPVHAVGFFQAILDAFADKASIVLVRKDAHAIGGLLALSHKDSLIVPWASSLREYLSLCPNMLLYWETLRMACLKGFRIFDFGRSSRDGGTYRFKRQWGAAEEPLFWYSIPVGRHPRPQLSPTDGPGVILARLWRSLPLPVTRWLGPIIRKSLTQ